VPRQPRQHRVGQRDRDRVRRQSDAGDKIESDWSVSAIRLPVQAARIDDTMAVAFQSCKLIRFNLQEE